MTTLRISASPVEFTASGYRMLVDFAAPPYRQTAEVARLGDVHAAIDQAKTTLRAIDPATLAKAGIVPNGFMLSATVTAGRAPAGFRQLPRSVFELRSVQS